MGGTTCACTTEGTAASGYQAWKAFDNNTSTNWQSSKNNGATDTLTFYTPTPINITKINWTTTGYSGGTVSISASLDDTDYTNLGSLTVSTASTTYTLQVDTPAYYKYIKFVNTPGQYRAQCRELSFKATYLDSGLPWYYDAWIADTPHNWCIKY